MVYKFLVLDSQHCTVKQTFRSFHFWYTIHCYLNGCEKLRFGEKLSDTWLIFQGEKSSRFIYGEPRVLHQIMKFVNPVKINKYTLN